MTVFERHTSSETAHLFPQVVPADKSVSTSALLPHCFSTEQIDRADRFSAWRHSYEPMVDLKERPTTCASAFSGEQVLWDLGEIALAEIRVKSLDFISWPMQMKNSGLDHWCLTLFLDGTCRTEASGDQYVSSSRLLQIHPLGSRFSGSLTDCNFIMLWIPRSLCSDSQHVLDSVAFQSIGGPLGQMLSSYITCLVAQLPYVTTTEASAVAHATRDMVIACVAPSADRINASKDQFAATLIERARKFIQQNLYNPVLGPDLLMREMAMSRTKLYNLFEPVGGIHRYIKRQRLCEAHKRLVDAQNPCRIQEIAERLGFSDGADFSRAFKREFSYTPSDARHHFIQASYQDTQSLDKLAPSDKLPFILRRLQF